MAPWGLGIVNSSRGHAGAQWGRGAALQGKGEPITGQGRSLKGRKWWVEEPLMASAGCLLPGWTSSLLLQALKGRGCLAWGGTEDEIPA